MMKLIKMTLVSALMATSGFATTAYLEAGKTITLSKETTIVDEVTTTAVGEFEITADKTLDMRGNEGSAATIVMNPGTKLTVNGNITVAEGYTGQIKNLDSTVTDNLPTIELAYQFGKSTDVSLNGTNSNDAYNAIITSYQTLSTAKSNPDSGSFTVYEPTTGAISDDVTYDPSKEAFNITSSDKVIEIDGIDRGTESRIIYDLDKNDESLKVVVTANGADNFGQSFCTTGNGSPELTLNVKPNWKVNLGQMTNGKVIINYGGDINTHTDLWPKCDLDFANTETATLKGTGMEVPANKTWSVTGSGNITIGADINVKGKLVL